MEIHNDPSRQHAILTCLSCMPGRILSLSHVENVTEFVLYDLSNHECFNLEKAAFFIDNPDFDCLKGVAGFSQAEKYGQNLAWDNPEGFSEFMRSCAFNQKVRSISRSSIKHAGKDTAAAVAEIAALLDLKDYGHHIFTMKHGNEGVLVFERGKETASDVQEFIPRGACLLGFCPVF